MTRAEILRHRELAHYYGDSADRTLRRDIEELAGRPFGDLPGLVEPPANDKSPHAYDVRYERDTKRIHLLPSSASAPLSDDELSLLETVAGSLRHDPLVGERLQRLLQRRGRAIAPARAGLSLLTLASDYSAHQGVLDRLLKAAHEKRAVNFDYDSTDGKRHFEEIDVVEINFHDGHYYFFGYHQDGQDTQFRVDRIEPSTFRLHPRYGTRRRPRTAKDIAVRYWLASEISNRGVSERLRDQQVTAVGDGVIVSGKARNLFEAERLLLGYGPLARALEPPELRAKMMENVRGMARLYAEDA